MFNRDELFDSLPLFVISIKFEYSGSCDEVLSSEFGVFASCALRLYIIHSGD